jgi:hypothetical protein
MFNGEEKQSMAPFSTFDERTSKLLCEAYDAVWKELEAATQPLPTQAATKARLTRGLLDAASAGERDPFKLKLAAIRGV